MRPRDRIGRELSRRDPILAAVIDRVGPLAPLHAKPGFDRLVETIIAQQLSSAAASTIERRVRALGRGRIPAPSRWSELSDATLRGAGLSRSKIDFVRRLAQRIDSRALRLREVDQLPDADVVARLSEEHGIGRWTAEMYLIFALGRPDVLPVGDLGFRAAVQRAYGLRRPPETTQLTRIGVAWRPWRSSATRYLWASLQLPAAGPRGAAGGNATVFGESGAT
ncbi:MAG: DNA-3-methyladenine glycosylase 2 family protein [Thermoplasmata archaeon]|nr:DNA-3-methyladenine glycosylase 2 family protein [Thermoplasmata archaeon]